MPEADRQPGGIRVAVAALPDIMVCLRGMTGFAVTQPDMIKIVYRANYWCLYGRCCRNLDNARWAQHGIFCSRCIRCGRTQIFPNLRYRCGNPHRRFRYNDLPVHRARGRINIRLCPGGQTALLPSLRYLRGRECTAANIYREDPDPRWWKLGFLLRGRRNIRLYRCGQKELLPIFPYLRDRECTAADRYREDLVSRQWRRGVSATWHERHSIYASVIKTCRFPIFLVVAFAAFTFEVIRVNII